MKIASTKLGARVEASRSILGWVKISLKTVKAKSSGGYANAALKPVGIRMNAHRLSLSPMLLGNGMMREVEIPKRDTIYDRRYSQYLYENRGCTSRLCSRNCCQALSLWRLNVVTC